MNTKMRTPAQTRMNAILKRLHEGGSVAVADLARDFEVSDMTVRRDLSELEREGLLHRVHGGARRRASGPLKVIDDVEPDFDARAAHNAPAKRLIAAEAAELLAGFRSVAIDVGSSCLFAAEALARRGGQRHIFTNSLRVATSLGAMGTEVYLPEGRTRPNELSITGPSAIESFSKLHFEVAVIGISGLSDEGFYDYSIEDSELKKIYLERSAHRVFLCDSTKFRRLSTIRVAALSEASVLITDAPPPSDLASALAGAGVEIRVAEET
ncbi:DeoR/GlpR family DNA-binding transcription regulator [Pseudooceanicola aestuarii]|uniref:DeoR/GlpR family DNA-binding transcription regulator n=1 Tax=Pseudooceanicola aestuarii TaxID=2697319 RepID=UPI001EF91BB9|nr:DeoR/GlpR family DNA-binding transcription regulator [Pseudooceanicola aestuarii]